MGPWGGSPGGGGGRRFFVVDWERAVGEGWYEPARQQEYLATGQGQRTRAAGLRGLLGEVPQPLDPAPQVRQGDGSAAEMGPLHTFAAACTSIMAMPGAQLGEVHPFSPPPVRLPTCQEVPVKMYKNPSNGSYLSRLRSKF